MLEQPMSRGALFVFEGCDRVGKSTQARRLLKRIQEYGRQAELIAFPDRSSDLGKFIDQYLKGQVELEAREAHLLFAANRHALVKRMREKLEKGISLIVDRFAYSGIAYTVAKEKNISLEWAKLHDVGMLRPDCVFFFDLSPEVAAKRSGYGGERLESYEYQCRVYEIMKKLGEQNHDIWKVCVQIFIFTQHSKFTG
ncbi:unnamed protein product [Anisakis simplex]|uniref:dTMP kinase n=1 Tax=Anisakis simplex TaxID=6269 RepID=A0A3P6RP12_ANISI|nr:unnamed protein product [Anisakis simplex]